MVLAAKSAAEEAGYKLVRRPGRGLSNIYDVTRNDETKTACIRTTRDTHIAFPPLEGGSKWRTLDEVDLVIVATVNDRENPTNVLVYVFPANEVRRRFNAAYAARKENGQVMRDGFGMWVSLGIDDRGLASSVGSGIVEKYKPIAIYSISDLRSTQVADVGDNEDLAKSIEETAVAPAIDSGPRTITDVVEWARRRIAEIAGTRIEAIKLDLRIEY